MPCYDVDDWEIADWRTLPYRPGALLAAPDGQAISQDPDEEYGE
jgi:hypothetical protein